MNGENELFYLFETVRTHTNYTGTQLASPRHRKEDIYYSLTTRHNHEMSDSPS